MTEALIAALGLFTGWVLGLTGAGGAILAVPMLMTGLGWSLTQAAPVALSAVFVAASIGTLSSFDVKFVRYKAALLMGAASLATAPVGLWLAHHLPLKTLTFLFSGLLCVSALRLWRLANRQALEIAAVSPIAVARLDARGRFRWTPPALGVIGLIGGSTGLMSGMFGVGGGFVMVPALRAFTELSIHSATATSLMAIALISGGTFTLAQFGSVTIDWSVNLWFGAATTVGVLFGRFVAPRVAGPWLQRFFVLVMLIAAGLVFRRAVQF